MPVKFNRLGTLKGKKRRTTENIFGSLSAHSRGFRRYASLALSHIGLRVASLVGLSRSGRTISQSARQSACQPAQNALSLASSVSTAAQSVLAAGRVKTYSPESKTIRFAFAYTPRRIDPSVSAVAVPTECRECFVRSYPTGLLGLCVNSCGGGSS